MPLRLFRGSVAPGREEDLITLLRNGVEREAPAPGLHSFMAGYRRVEGVEQFLLASAWESDADVRRSLGEDPLTRPNTIDKLGPVAQVDSIDHYELIRPLPRGLLDAPGAVLRATRAVLRPGRFEALLDWLARKEREIGAAQLMLGWMIGWRERDGQTEFAGVSAWASPLQYEAVADAGLADSMLFAELEQFVTDFRVEVYQAIELRLSARLQALGARRLIVARFGSAEAADRARSRLVSVAAVPADDVSVAGMAGGLDGKSQVFVARVELAQHARAERLIADHGGQIVYEADEHNGAAHGGARPYPG